MGDIMVLEIGSIAVAVWRVICSALDTVVYWALTCVYNLLTDISSVNLFGADGAGEFGTRIYTIIGVIMLFKLAFSVLTYIIDPDKMTDNKNGFGTIVKDIVIMFVLIVTVPLIFKTAMGLQYLILEDDTIGRLITGHHSGNYESMGDRLATNILMTFIHPNEAYFPECNGVMGKDDDGYSDCLNALSSYSDVKAQYEQVFNDQTFGRQHLLRLGIMTNKVNGHSDEFVITYHTIVSTLVGGFAAYILLLFCIDIGVRTVKMAFLQLIAPIPIVAYMDEKGKTGIFNKWVKTCTSTYLDLFVRLAGIDFATYLIAEFIYNNQAKICHWKLEGTTLSSFDCRTPGPFVTLFLVLGVLVFAKQLPKLIEEITGLKLGGSFQLNPLKKIQDEALFGKQVSSGLAFAGRTGRNLALAGGAIAGNQLMKNRYINGAVNGIAGFGKGIGNIFHGAGGAVGDYLSSTAGGRYFDRIGADAQGTVGEVIPYIKQRDDKRIADLKRINDAVSNMESRAKEKIANGEAGHLSDTYNHYQAELERLKNNVISRDDYAIMNEDGTYKLDDNGNKLFNDTAYQAAVARQQADLERTTSEFNEWYNNAGMYEYIDSVGANDAALQGFKKDYDQAIRVSGETAAANAEEMHSQMGKNKGKISDINRKRMAAEQAKSGN